MPILSRRSPASPASPARVTALALALGSLLAFPLSRGDRAFAQETTRLVAVGDIHGDADNFAAILRQAGLVDEHLDWIGGRATLVQTGDCFDRGAKVRQVLDLLMKLETQAAAAGGRVVPLFGNHDIMNLLGITRDVNPEVYASFTDGDSGQRRERAYADYVKLADARAKAFAARPAVYNQSRARWMAAHPPGYVEYEASLAPDGAYGQWLRQHAVAVVVNRTILMHAGLDPNTAPATIAAVNALVHKDLDAFDGYRTTLVDRGLILPSFSMDELGSAVQAEVAALNAASAAAQAGDELAAARLKEADPRLLDALKGVSALGRSSLLASNGPMWFRGFATWASDEGMPRITVLLGRYDALRFVVGHTTMSSGRIEPRFSSRVFLIDTGMLTGYYQGGRPSALSITPTEIAAVYLDSTVALVTSMGEAVAH